MKAGRGFLALFAVLTAGALGAPLAHAGSYDANDAWVVGHDPAGYASHATDASCPKSGDPLVALLPPPNRCAPGTYTALWFSAPSTTAITQYTFVRRDYGWGTVKTTRTRKGGAYSTRYHFNSAGGRFTFRMRLRPNDSYPYARGTSTARRVSLG